MTENIFDVVNEKEEIERIIAERNYLRAICICHDKNSFDEFNGYLSIECVLRTYEGNEISGKDAIIQYLNQISDTSFENDKCISYNAGIQLPVFDEVSEYGFGKHCLSISDNNHLVAQCFLELDDANKIKKIVFETEHLITNICFTNQKENNFDTIGSTAMAVNLLNLTYKERWNTLYGLICDKTAPDADVFDANCQRSIRKGSVACTKFLEDLFVDSPEGTGKFEKVFRCYEMFAVRTAQKHAFFIIPIISTMGQFQHFVYRHLEG